MRNNLHSNRALFSLAASTLILTGCVTRPNSTLMAGAIDVGRDAQGDPCRATRTYDDPTLKGKFDVGFVITCRSVTASRSVGTIRSFVDAPGALDSLEASISCGQATPVQVGSLRGNARRCYDSFLHSDAVVIAAKSADRTVVGSAAPALVQPLERGMLALAGSPVDAQNAVRANVDFATLAPPPQSTSTATGADFDPQSALLQTIALNRNGHHIEASRIANDALSRLPAEASPSTRAELSLEAALADSNIRFNQTAAEHFARADAIMAAAPDATSGFLTSKRDAYKALDLINQGKFRAALEMLNRIAGPLAGSEQPLEDPAIINALNRPAAPRGSVQRSVDVPNARELDKLLLRAQANWAKSVALLALGDAAGADAAIRTAEYDLQPFHSPEISPTVALWMEARIERQRGRVAASTGNWTAALAAYDRAAEALRQSAIATSSGSEPAIAQLLLERAAILQRAGTSGEALRAQYARALDALIESGMPGGVPPAGLEQYLDLLVATNTGAADAASEEDFFRAMQAVNKPAIERQMNRIRSILQADPAVGAKLRDRIDLERELTKVRYQIAELDPAQKGDAGDLDRRRAAAQDRLTRLDAELSADPRLKLYDEQPATVQEVRSALRPDEAYFKLTELRGKDYAILITPQDTLIYRVDAPAKALNALAARVRDSIDGHLAEGRVDAYDVAAAYTLYHLIAGPAAQRLGQVSTLIVDPSGPLERLPMGVLVTDQDSVAKYKAAAAANAFDFTSVAFLANRAELSTEVSPRSFLIARALPPSHAHRPFIGFADAAPPSPGAADARVDVGDLCYVDSQALRQLAASAPPIPAAEVQLAANALGDPNAPLVTRAAFTDTAVENMADLGDFAILHFATHGLEEGVWGCPKSPPALVTSFGDANSDGLLSFDEIAGLRLDANLVVLSACDTGSGIRSQDIARLSGQEEAGSTLEGLVRSFLTANARAVLATHWEVPVAEGTPELMERFYTSARTADIGASLQAAQRQLMTNPKYSHPFYWGAYFIVGDARKSALARAAPMQTANK
jgi:CHAT domain-containing protein